MPFARIRGIRMYFERAGSGPPLLFVNGSGGDLRARPGPFDGPLAAHFDLLAHDQRALGQTELPSEPPTMAAGEPGREEGARAQLEARRRHDVADRLAAVTMPTLVCAGRYDGIAPVANSEAIVSRMPDATLDVFEGGHLFLVQDRRANERILAFLRES